MSEGVNAAEMVRGYFAEVRLGRALVLRPAGYPAKTYEEDIRTVPMTAVTDCRSLYDCLTGVGKRPSEARLALDIGALKEFQELTFRWTRTAQMIADPLTKASAPIFYMVWTFWRHEFYYRHDEQLDRKLEYVKGAIQRLRLEQWRKRQAMRQGADQAGYATLAITDEGQAERRSLMAQRLIETAEAARRSELQIGSEGIVRDHWIREWHAETAGQLEIKATEILAIRVHLKRRILDFQPSEEDVSAKDLAGSTRYTVLENDAIHEDTEWNGRRAAVTLGTVGERALTLFARRKRRRRPHGALVASPVPVLSERRSRTTSALAQAPAEAAAAVAPQ